MSDVGFLSSSSLVRVGKDLGRSLVQPSVQSLGLDILPALPGSCEAGGGGGGLGTVSELASV